jgi:hypothetical protein
MVNAELCPAGTRYKQTSSQQHSLKKHRIKRQFLLKIMFLLRIIAGKINFHHVPQNNSTEQRLLQQITIANHV